MRDIKKYDREYYATKRRKVIILTPKKVAANIEEMKSKGLPTEIHNVQHYIFTKFMKENKTLQFPL